VTSSLTPEIQEHVQRLHALTLPWMP
jgi:hypothetical protein